MGDSKMADNQKCLEDVVCNFDINAVVQKLAFLGRIMRLDEIDFGQGECHLSCDDILGISSILENTANEISEFSSDLYCIIGE